MGRRTTNTNSKKRAKYDSDDAFINDDNSFNEKNKIISNTLKFKKVKLSEKQNQLFNLIKQSKICVAVGPPGTAKSFTALYAALKLYNDEFCEKIIITKPTEIVGASQLGFLKGDLNEKLGPYMDSFVSVCEDILDKECLSQMLVNNNIIYKPVQFMRGATFKNTVVIIDEFQSFDIKELMAIVTRFGNIKCKMVFIGDINQNDIDKRYVAVNVFKEILKGIDGISMFEFDRTDIVRDPILIEICDRYDKIKDEGKLTLNRKNT